MGCFLLPQPLLQGSLCSLAWPQLALSLFIETLYIDHTPPSCLNINCLFFVHLNHILPAPFLSFSVSVYPFPMCPSTSSPTFVSASISPPPGIYCANRAVQWTTPCEVPATLATVRHLQPDLRSMDIHLVPQGGYSKALPPLVLGFSHEQLSVFQ